MKWKTPCTHSNNSIFQCAKLSISTLKRAKNIVYVDTDKKNQDNRIAYLILPMREHVQNKANPKRKVSVQYCIKAYKNSETMYFCHVHITGGNLIFFSFF